MSVRSTLIAVAAALALLPNVSEARGGISGNVQSLQHYSGHAGVLLKLKQPMIDPDSCGRTDWYIVPDASARSQFVQAMLLSAEATGQHLDIILDGCVDGMPSIYALTSTTTQ